MRFVHSKRGMKQLTLNYESIERPRPQIGRRQRSVELSIEWDRRVRRAIPDSRHRAKTAKQIAAQGGVHAYSVSRFVQRMPDVERTTDTPSRFYLAPTIYAPLTDLQFDLLAWSEDRGLFCMADLLAEFGESQVEITYSIEYLTLISFWREFTKSVGVVGRSQRQTICRWAITPVGRRYLGQPDDALKRMSYVISN